MSSSDQAQNSSSSVEQIGERGEQPQGLERKLITGFIIFYLYTSIVQILPPSPLSSALFEPLRPAVICAGLQQAWNLFAPVVRLDNMHTLATVTYKDGSLALYEFPRVEMLTPLEAFKRVKLIKALIDNMFMGADDPLCRFSADLVARGKWNPDNPPTTIALTGQTAPIPRFAEHFVTRAQLPQHYKRSTYYVYEVLSGEQK